MTFRLFLVCLVTAFLSTAHPGPLLADADTRTTGVPDDVLRATLPNGLRVVIVPDRLAPVVSTELTYLAGSNDAPDGFPGTAHALEHMMFRGSRSLDRDQMAELGALLGGHYNAETRETITRYTYTVPATDLDLVLHIEAARMQGLLLDQADWEQERGAIDQEVSRDLSSPMYTYFSQVQSILFAGTPYEHDALGTRESFARTDAALLRAFYDTWYVPNNAVLVIAGDVRPEAVLAQVQAQFVGIPSRMVPPHAVSTPRPVEAKTLTLPTNFSVGLVTLAYRFPGLKSNDFAAADILGDVLGSQRGALYAMVPAGRALSADFSFHALPDAGYAVAYAAYPDGNNPEPVLAEVKSVLADIVRNGVPPELVEAARQQELAQLAFRNDSISGLASSWSDALTMQGSQSPEDIAKAYLAVTVDDVNRMARMLLQPEHAVTAILTPRRSGAQVASNGFGAPESFNRPPDHPVTLPDWAQSAIADVRVPAEVAAPEVAVLPNGLRLIVQPEHVSRTVSVYGRIRQVAETQEPKGKEGIAALTAELYAYGTDKRDRLSLRAAIDAIVARERAGPMFELKVLAQHFEAGMHLLAEHQLHPAYPPEAFAIARQQLAQGLDGMMRTPDFGVREAVKHALVPQGDPSLRQAMPDTVARLEPSDITAWMAAAYRPDLTTIVIVGDVTVEEARRVVAATFGDWHAVGPTPDVELPPVPPNRASQAVIPDSSSVQDSVLLAQSVSLPVTSPDRYTLILGNIILGDGFSSRLYRDLRVRTGYVYSVDSSLSWSRTRGRYQVSFGADPDKVEKARALVLRDLKDMQSEPVSDAELHRAKMQVMRQLQMQRASIPAIAALDLYLDRLGLPMDASQIAARHYLTVTARDVQTAFAVWLRPDDLATVVKGPPPVE